MVQIKKRIANMEIQSWQPLRVFPKNSTDLHYYD